MKKLIYIVSLLCCMAMAGQALAISLTLTPSSLAIDQGDFADVYLGISGLGSGTNLGAFSLDIIYDPTKLSFSNALFYNSLGDPSLFEAATFQSDVSGRLRLVEISWLGIPELVALQGSSFNLAKLSFTGIGSGLSQFAMENVELSDAFGSTLLVAPVPEPGTFLLLGLG